MNHDKKLFHVCETCGFKFGKKDYYDNHVKFIHPLPQEDDDDDEEEFLDDPLENEQDAQELILSSAKLDALSKSKRNSPFDLSNTQLLTILEQNQGRRITIVGPDGDVKYLSVTPKQQTTASPQVEKIICTQKCMINIRVCPGRQHGDSGENHQPVVPANCETACSYREFRGP